MANLTDNTKRRYEAVRADYAKWSNKKYKGVKIYADPYIYFKLSEKYFLSPRTVEEIIFYRTKY